MNKKLRHSIRSTKVNRIIIILLFLIIIGSPLYSHGINSRIIKGGIGIIALYDSSTPMSYAKTEIFTPGKDKTPFQEGLTDKNGCFIFIPDKIGIWKIKINDEMGHGVIKEINVKDLKNFKQNKSEPLSRWYKILIGLSIIFGITGFIFYLQAKKIIAKGQKDAHS